MENINKRVELEVCESAFNKRLRTFNIVNKVARVDIEEFLWDAFDIYKSEISSIHELHNMVKSSTTLVAEFEKKILNANEKNVPGPSTSTSASESNTTEETIKQTLYFTSRTVTIALGVDWRQHFKQYVIDELKESVENTAIQGSGFTLAQIIKLNVQVSSLKPLNGGSYFEAPKKLMRRGAIINVKNNDNMCFKWAILSCLHNDKVNHMPNRVNHYIPYENELNFNNIDFPVCLKDIDKFEQQNENISINVYHYDDRTDLVSTLRVSNNVKEKHIHLLMLTNSSRVNTDGATSTAGKVKIMLESNQVKTHYCWIKSLNRLIDHQLNNHQHKYFICDRCLNYFEEKKDLERHYGKCQNECHIEMPTKDNNIIKFENHQKQLKAPFIIYADTEAYLKQLSEEERNRVFSETSSTVAYQEHKVYSVGYYFKCEYDDSLSHYKTSGIKANCIEWFINELHCIANFVEKQLNKNEPMKEMDWDEAFIFSDPESVCSICGLQFNPSETRVRDHCHFTGKFRGPAHVNCNLKYKESREIPIIMHNLSGYDAHLFIKQLATQMEGDVNIIPNNSEQYISFSKVVDDGIKQRSERKDKIKLKFLDSCRFMHESLAQLASLIPTEKKCILYKEFRKEYSPELLCMLERKGVFPYDYVDSFQRLKETALPWKEQFYSKLYNEHIDDDEYDFAREIWNKFGIKTLGEYSELYLKTDVLLLADVFENFRDMCHEIYNLDPAHYYTAPGLSFDAMLKYTKVNIELLTDIDMLLFVERGIRGGITQCNKRYVEANNKYMKEGYDPSKKTNYLMYLDANNLYGYAMCQPLPIGEYKWADFDLSNIENMKKIIEDLPDDSDTGYIFEVDLDYPDYIHNEHNDFPFCAERMKLPQQAFDILKDRASKVVG
ncbi:uncharacterized protein LOC129570437 [Sitodiplosis mosellana]|uniref:uncharacterized protein LOC129570437 n=1 Tax=Sitodiplosis mosellana TaxID=263140 RepID=UPI002444C79E|nr:uncharacterized protein LOC129570437 [Sitodiplosis mosellana]